MNIAGAFVQRVYRSPDPSGHMLAGALAALQSLHPGALGLTRAISTGRRSPWQRVCSILEPLLDALIPPELRAPHLLILVPGRLRSLPWAGLRLRNQPLHRVAHTIRLLPAIGFTQNAAVTTLDRGRKHACLLAENLPEQSEGETRFGAATIRTLRAWFPPDAIIEPPGPVPDRTIVEGDAIEAIDHELASLRMYGVATLAFNLNTSTSGLALSNQRMLAHHNTRMTKLSASECVEPWVETGCEGAAALALQDDQDRIPGLAWSFLSCGANGVVDLAWPDRPRAKEARKSTCRLRFGGRKMSWPARPCWFRSCGSADGRLPIPGLRSSVLDSLRSRRCFLMKRSGWTAASLQPTGIMEGFARSNFR